MSNKLLYRILIFLGFLILTIYWNILPVLAVNINKCMYIDGVIGENYSLTSNLAQNTTIDACLHIKDSLNINIYCNDYMVSGYTNRKSVWVENSAFVNFYNCDFRFGDSPDGLVYFDGALGSGIYNSILHLLGAGGYYPSLEVYNSNSFEANNINITWDGSRFPGIYIDSSDNGTYNNIIVDSGSAGVDDGDGIYITFNSHFNNFSNITSFGSSEYGFRVGGDNNYISNSNSSLNKLSGFDFEGDNNTCFNCWSQLNDGNGFWLEGNYNDILSSTSFGDVLSPVGLDECGLRIEGNYNNIQIFYSDSNDRCALSFEGNYNIINNSIIQSKSTQNHLEGGLIKFEGIYNDLRYSWIEINTTGKVFFVLGNNNEIFNNFINITENIMIINKSPNYYNYFYRLPEFGSPVYPIDNPNPYIGGNYWENNSGGYSVSCVDNNRNGFCDNPFVLNGVNSTDVYPISNQWECVPNINLTVMNLTPSNGTVTVGETIIVTMKNSYTYDSISGQNCSYPTGISFIDCHYNTSLGVDVDYWWGAMNDSVYDTCIGIGTYECNRTIDWKSDRNITSDSTYRTFMSCWTRDYYGNYIDLDGDYLEWLPSTMTAVLTPEGGTDIDLNFDTCNHFLYDNATICMSAVGSTSSSPLESQQPLLSCYDWDNDGIYDDAYILTGESYYVNTSCYGDPDIHSELWNTTICIDNDYLTDSGTYWGEGYVKLLVANSDEVIGTTNQYIEFFDDISSTSLHRRPFNIDLFNIYNSNGTNLSVVEKGNGTYIRFNGDALITSDPIGCVMFGIVSPTYDPGIIRYCVYNNSELKGSIGCNCTNTSTKQGFYKYEVNPTNFSLYLEYNISRYGFNITSNLTSGYSENLGLPFYYTFPRAVGVSITESNNCYNDVDDFTYFIFDGICLDDEWDFYEQPMDYGGLNNKCGTCFDDLLSPLIGEVEIDYGGYFCGFCKPDVSKSNDEIWLMLKSFMEVNDTLGGILNQTVYGWIPFRQKWCTDSEETIGAINAMIGSTLIMLLIILIIVLIFVLFSLLFGGAFWFKLILFFIKRRKKK